MKKIKEASPKGDTASRPKKAGKGKQSSSRPSSVSLNPRVVAKIRQLIREELTRAQVERSTVQSRPAIDPNLVSDVGDFVDDPEGWFHTPNVEFEGRAPIELLGTPEEARLRNRIEMAKYGLFS